MYETEKSHNYNTFFTIFLFFLHLVIENLSEYPLYSRKAINRGVCQPFWRHLGTKPSPRFPGEDRDCTKNFKTTKKLRKKFIYAKISRSRCLPLHTKTSLKSRKTSINVHDIINIGMYLLTLIRCRKSNWSHVSSILTIPTKAQVFITR